MTPSKQHCGGVIAGLASLAGLFVLLVSSTAQAQTYQVIYNFSGCADGYAPSSTLILGGAGRLYGTAPWGGDGCGHDSSGVVFRLERAGSAWVETPIHTFTGYDGDEPGQLTVAPDGSFYLPTDGGGEYGLGMVSRLQPPATACEAALCPWLASLLYSFGNDGPGGYVPVPFILYSGGNLYGLTLALNGNTEGIVFELTNSGGTWTENVLYELGYGGYDFGTYSNSGLIMDSAGNLYGTTFDGGTTGNGSIFELTPSGSGWTFNTLYSLTYADGSGPQGSLVMDSAGNLYGNTARGGTGDPTGGAVFELSPSQGGWTFTGLCSFSGIFGSWSALTLDAAGNLYGTTASDGAHNEGSVFKVTHNGTGWTCTDLHDFPGQQGDGEVPIGGVTVDASGNLYGTTSAGGANGAGVVWEITP
jgi:uncharacterized repeat protein (TIGR03803 family)